MLVGQTQASFESSKLMNWFVFRMAWWTDSFKPPHRDQKQSVGLFPVLVDVSLGSSRPFYSWICNCWPISLFLRTKREFLLVGKMGWSCMLHACCIRCINVEVHNNCWSMYNWKSIGIYDFIVSMSLLNYLNTPLFRANRTCNIIFVLTEIVFFFIFSGREMTTKLKC